MDCNEVISLVESLRLDGDTHELLCCESCHEDYDRGYPVSSVVRISGENGDCTVCCRVRRWLWRHGFLD